MYTGIEVHIREESDENSHIETDEVTCFMIERNTKDLKLGN